jgi:hypothetical protein
LHIRNARRNVWVWQMNICFPYFLWGNYIHLGERKVGSSCNCSKISKNMNHPGVASIPFKSMKSDAFCVCIPYECPTLALILIDGCNGCGLGVGCELLSCDNPPFRSSLEPPVAVESPLICETLHRSVKICCISSCPPPSTNDFSFAS